MSGTRAMAGLSADLFDTHGRPMFGAAPLSLFSDAKLAWDIIPVAAVQLPPVAFTEYDALLIAGQGFRKRSSRTRAGASARIGADPLLIQAAGGNTSVKEGGAMWIKASGTLLAEALTRDVFVPVDLAAMREALNAGAPSADRPSEFLLSPSPLRPSAETCLHAVFPEAPLGQRASTGADRPGAGSPRITTGTAMKRAVFARAITRRIRGSVGSAGGLSVRCLTLRPSACRAEEKGPAPEEEDRCGATLRARSAARRLRRGWVRGRLASMNRNGEAREYN